MIFQKKKELFSILFSMVFLSTVKIFAQNGSGTILPVKYLALGDSYTIGESVGEMDRWPVQLAIQLRGKGISINDPIFIARTGWTTKELSLHLEKENPSPEFDLVTLLIGVNDQFRYHTVSSYRKEFRSMLGRAIQLAKGKASRVVVLSIPDWGVTPTGLGSKRPKISLEIDKFNQINLDETRKQGAFYVDITAESRTAKKNKDLIASDGLHPSKEMYKEWVDVALPVVLKAIQ